MGVGAQDSFGQALDCLDRTGITTPTMLWDPTFDTWRLFGTRINSQMILLSGDLTVGSELFYGFNDDDQQSILDALGEFS